MQGDKCTGAWGQDVDTWGRGHFSTYHNDGTQFHVKLVQIFEINSEGKISLETIPLSSFGLLLLLHSENMHLF